jgi:DNA polymerase I-like protein with 3'-5' exonuclease and polymerase domains
VNWAAMNKSDGSRANVISRFDGGTLLQFDYESYHIRIIGKMIGYVFPDGETAHEHLAKYYGVTTEESKALSFRYLYGGLDEFAKTIPFFQKVDEYIQTIWKEFVISGKLTTPIYKRDIPFERIESATEQKVFNYLIQALETELNYVKIDSVLKFLNGKLSKMILYTYDAFLIDTHPSERDEILNSVKLVMEKGGFPVRMEEGKNYDNLSIIK